MINNSVGRTYQLNPVDAKVRSKICNRWRAISDKTDVTGLGQRVITYHVGSYKGQVVASCVALEGNLRISYRIVWYERNIRSRGCSPVPACWSLIAQVSQLGCIIDGKNCEV